MAEHARSFGEFAIGDFVVFDRTFTNEDFAVFTRMSGDANPLHHDAAYAGSTEFGRPIVPLHLALSPLSAVAGMVFPGEPSLYLGHEVRAIRPIYYGDRIRYSAAITAINESHKVLSVRTLGIRGDEVVLEAKMSVQATRPVWNSPASLPIRNAKAPSVALVTGASGDIGSAIAIALASRGWRLLLQDRGDGKHRQRLRGIIPEKSLSFCTADLATEAGRQTLAAAAGQPDLGLVIHAASSAVDSPLEELVATNYVALRELARAVTPTMLERQGGAVLFLSSLAMEYVSRGWENYVAAKQMATGFMRAFDLANARYGVRGLTLMPGFVATPFSEKLRDDAQPLSASEVADAALALIGSEAGGNVMLLEVGRVRRGAVGFHDDQRPSGAAAPAPLPAAGEKSAAAANMVAGAPLQAPSRVADIVRGALRLPAGTDLAGAALGMTAGWDSLSHIDLLIELERTLSIRFTSQEIEATQSFAELERLCTAKIVSKGGS